MTQSLIKPTLNPRTTHELVLAPRLPGYEPSVSEMFGVTEERTEELEAQLGTLVNAPGANIHTIVTGMTQMKVTPEEWAALLIQLGAFLHANGELDV